MGYFYFKYVLFFIIHKSLNFLLCFNSNAKNLQKLQFNKNKV